MVRRALVVLVVSLLGLGLARAQTPAEPQAPAADNPAQAGPPRIAFVVGNAAYTKGPLQNSLNDAGLVAEALRSIGFDIIDGADLSQADFIRSFRDFLAKLEAAGPDAIAFVYFSGYGFEYEGDNYLVAADARLERENDIPLDAVRLSDLIKPLAGAPAAAKVVIIDAARKLPFAIESANAAHGLAAIDPPPGMLVAFSQGPGTLAEDGAGPYGAYATALAEMLRDPGIDLDAAFTRVRTRTHQLTEGRQTPWNVSALHDPIVLVPQDAVAGAPGAAPAPPPPPAKRAAQPMRDIGPDEAYAQAIETDTLPAYTEFVETYPQNPYAPRVWAIIRARREALAWMRAVELDTPQAYWTYLRRYPHGIYAADAERRLRRLAAALAPPPDFAPVEFYDVPPPLPDEPADYVAFYPAAPPPPPILIEPPPVFFVHLRPPPPRPGPRILPMPAPFPAFRHIRPGVRQAVTAPAPTPRSNVVAPPPGPQLRSPQPRALPPTSLRPPSANAVPTAPGAPPNSRRLQGPPPNVAPGRTPPASATPPQRRITPNATTTAPPTTRPTTTAPAGPRPQTATQPPPGNRPATRLTPPGPQPNTQNGARAPGHPPAPGINRPPPPAAVHRPPPPPPAVHRAPPPPTARAAPPPPTVNRPPPPAAVHRPPPPPPAVHRPPPPPTARAAPPPVQRAAPPARPAAPAAARKNCRVENGKEVCK